MNLHYFLIDYELSLFPDNEAARSGVVVCDLSEKREVVIVATSVSPARSAKKCKLSGAGKTWDRIKEAQLSRTQLSKIQLSKIQLSSIQLFKIQLSKTQLSRTQLSKIQLSKIQLASIQLSKIQFTKP